MPQKNLIEIYLEASDLIETGAVWLREDGQIIGVNSIFANELGAQRETLAQKTIFQVDAHMNLLTWKKTWKELQAKGQITFDTEYVTAEGLLYPVRMKGLLIDVGTEKVCVGLAQNLIEKNRYKDMLDLVASISKVGGWEWDLLKNELLLTSEIYNILEINQKEIQLTFENAWDYGSALLSEEAQSAFKSAIEETLKTGKSLHLDLKLHFEGGRTKDVECTAVAYHSEGQTVKLYGAIRDVSNITARFQPLELTKYTLDHAGEMIFWVDEEGSIIYANNVCVKTFGYSKEELYDLKIFQLDSDLSKKDWTDNWNFFKKEKVVKAYVNKIKKDGTLFPVETITNYIEYEDKAILCKFCRNLSDVIEEKKQLTLSKQLIDQAHEMMFWIKKDASIFYANEIACANMGYSKDELLRMKTFDLNDEVPREKWLRHWERVKEEKTYHSDKQWFKKKDGTLFPVEVLAVHLELNGEEYHCATVTDLTEKRKKDEKIELAQATINQAPHMVYWLHADGSFYYCNEHFYRALGYSAGEISKMNVLDLFPAYGKKEFEESWDRLRNGQIIENELEVTAKSGKKIPIDAIISLVKFDGKEFACGRLIDISERKQAEQAARTSREQFHSVVNSATDAIIIADGHSNIISWNQSAEKIFGWKEKEIIGKPLSAIIPHHYREKHIEGINRYLKTKKQRVIGHVVELAGLRKDGTEFPIEISLGTWETGDEVFFCGILRDVSARKEKENRLNAALEENALLKKQLELENEYLQSEINLSYNFNNIISANKNYKKILAQVEQVADTDATVLILGETGTGKELLARAIHNLSERENRQLVKVNCAALPENLIESELFGHEKGAFTGAFQRKTGKFELAHKGTLFLDEIGEMPLDLQSKLLRVLQEGEFERVGGTQTLKVDVRVIAATNRDIEQLVREGNFRLDLYYRLNVFPIVNLPLRERKEDIPLLIRHFVEKYSEKAAKKITKIPQHIIDKLFQYEFPGNIRELENIIERAVILTNGDTLKADLSFMEHKSGNLADGVDPVFLTFNEVQKNHIVKALDRTNWRVSGETGAARLLGLNDKTLFSKMKKLKISRD